MAQASLGYDGCSYAENLRMSIGEGVYQLNRPANDNNSCGKDIPNDPFLRWQAWGPGFCAPGATVDVNSELLGLPYHNSLCSADKYLPGKYQPPAGGYCAAPGGDGAGQRCSTPTETTRLSNPPCTLRGTGWNRWEWLCYDPQDRAIIPFDWNVSYRTIVKDNHKPCLPTPMDQTAALPQAAADPTGNLGHFIDNWVPPPEAQAPGSASPSWATCGRMSGLGA